jgi:hypothetical protein
MPKLAVLAAVCALAACSDSKTPDSHGHSREDAGVGDHADASEGSPDAAAPEESSALERAPGALAKPPTKLPDDLRPPK